MWSLNRKQAMNLVATLLPILHQMTVVFFLLVIYNFKS